MPADPFDKKRPGWQDQIFAHQHDRFGSQRTRFPAGTAGFRRKNIRGGQEPGRNGRLSGQKLGRVPQTHGALLHRTLLHILSKAKT